LASSSIYHCPRVPVLGSMGRWWRRAWVAVIAPSGGTLLKSRWRQVPPWRHDVLCTRLLASLRRAPIRPTAERVPPKAKSGVLMRRGAKVMAPRQWGCGVRPSDCIYRAGALLPLLPSPSDPSVKVAMEVATHGFFVGFARNLTRAYHNPPTWCSSYRCAFTWSKDSMEPLLKIRPGGEFMC
jgi:hypothetical protein